MVEVYICYSKEVNLVTGSSILSIAFWTAHSLKLLKFLNDKSKFCLYLLLGYSLVGFHQIFEFLSIYTQNQYIYKIGLLCSISAMIFNFKASEIFLGQKIKFNWIYISLFILILHLLTRELIFSNAHFYVRGESHFYWGALWMLYFLYWNFLHFFSFKKLVAPFNKLSLQIPFVALNISFLMAATYSFAFGLIRNHLTPERLQTCSPIISNFEIVFDAPSIWCCFATVQGLFLYYFIKKLYAENIIFEKHQIDLESKKAFFYSIIVLVIIFTTLPIFSALSYKMITK